MKSGLRLIIIIALLAGYGAARPQRAVSAAIESAGSGMDKLVFLPLVGKPHPGPLGGVYGRVIDATTGAGIPSVSVCRIDTYECAFTQADGSYSLEGLPVGSTMLVLHPQGYYYREQPIDVVANTKIKMQFIMVPYLKEGEQRYVLTWQQDGDLDANLWLADDTRIWWRNSGLNENDQCTQQACLEYDNRLTGPESIFSLERTTGTYTFAVFRNGDAEVTQYGASLSIYESQGVIATFNCPEEGVGSWWWVFEMDGDTGEIIELNEISTSPPR